MNALIHNLEALLINAGCTLVLYETDNLSNIRTDESKPADIIGLVVQPNQMSLQVKANAITERPILTVEILQQVRPEDLVYHNEHILENLLEVVKLFIYKAIDAGIFHKILDITLDKVTERKYDANVIGWSIPLTWILIENEDHCPPAASPIVEDYVFLVDDDGDFITDNTGNLIILN